jgi:hypothetical protein
MKNRNIKSDSLRIFQPEEKHMILVFEGNDITKWNRYKCAGQTSKEKAGSAASGITSSMADASSHKDPSITRQ